MMERKTTKALILEATERLVAEHGFESVSLRDITNDAKVNVAAVNYHFGSKEGLFRSVFERRAIMLNAARMEALDACLAAAGGAARRDGFDGYGDTRYHATTPTRRRFERTRPPHPAVPVAFTNPHSCQPPCCPALCQGRPIGRRATSAAVEADAGRDIAAMTRLERMTDCPAALDRKGRRTHGLMAVGGRGAVFVVGGGD